MDSIYATTATAALWLLQLIAFVFLFALARQIGVLHQRIGPSGARITNTGLDIGELAPYQALTTLDGSVVSFWPQQAYRTILLFVSTTCPSCVDLFQALRHEHFPAGTRPMLVFDASDPAEVLAILKNHRLQHLPAAISPEAARAFGVTLVPYAFAVDGTGLIRSKGLVDTGEHLESIVNSLHTGFVSAEDASRPHRAAAPSVAFSDSNNYRARR